MEEQKTSLPCRIAIGCIHFYQNAISPFFPPSCRFVPTCSQYGVMAFQKYGFKKGFILTAKRLSKCHPGGPYGFDPLP